MNLISDHQKKMDKKTDPSYQIIFFYTNKRVLWYSSGIECLMESIVTKESEFEEKYKLYINPFTYENVKEPEEAVSFDRASVVSGVDDYKLVKIDDNNKTIATSEECYKFCNSLNVKGHITTIDIIFPFGKQDNLLGSVVIFRHLSNVKKYWTVENGKKDFDEIKIAILKSYDTLDKKI
jgi:hypothetical protein